jgi:predicted DNA-binding transcriptional regulator AlpA
MTDDPILTASEVDKLQCTKFACSPSSAKRWRLSDPSFPKPCTPKVARPRWRRADVMEWIESR